jgi:hypothetical protein
MSICPSMPSFSSCTVTRALIGQSVPSLCVQPCTVYGDAQRFARRGRWLPTARVALRKAGVKRILSVDDERPVLSADRVVARFALHVAGKNRIRYPQCLGCWASTMYFA